MLMRYPLVFLLLAAFIPISVLGHAGFQFFGIHSHCNCQTAHQSSSNNYGKSCHHRNHSHNHGDAHTDTTQQWPSHNSSNPLSSSSDSQDCVLCQFLRHAKPQVSLINIPDSVSSLVSQRLIFLNDVLVVFDHSLRPIPRGPPAHVS